MSLSTSGTVRAVSIWTTPEGPKATLNYLYYGWKYLGVWETGKYAKAFLRDFHDVVARVFDQLIEKFGQKKKDSIGGSGSGGASGGSGAGDSGSGDGSDANKIKEDADEDNCIAFPDFIGADSKIRGMSCVKENKARAGNEMRPKCINS